MTSWIRHLRYALRTLRKHPGNTLLCLTALAIGIGLCTAMFNVLSGMVLRGLPFPDADRLYSVARVAKIRSVWANSLNYRDYELVRDHQESFEELAGMVGDFLALTDQSGLPEQIETAAVTHQLFAALGVEPVVGRVLEPPDDVLGAPRVALLSHQLWTSRYGASGDVLGTTVRVDGEPTTVVGVLPAGFRFPWNAHVWIPLRLFPTLVESNAAWVYACGRLKEDRTPAQAREELAAVFTALEAASSDPDAKLGPHVEPLRVVMGHYVWHQIAWVMTGAVLFVLAIACFNVAHLRLVRTLERSRELRIRRALGASLGDVASLVTAESVLLAAGGLLGGVVVAQALKNAFNGFLQQDANLVWWRYLWDFSFDARTFAWTASAAVLSAVAASLLPIWFLRRSGERGAAADVRTTAGRSASRWSDLLVAGQVALTFVLLTATGLLVKSLVRLDENRLPYDLERIALARVLIGAGDYSTASARLRFYQTLRQRVAELPGVESVSLTSRQQHWPSDLTRFEPPGESYPDAGSRPLTRWEAVLPGYFETLGAKVLEGRPVTSADTAQSRPVAVVNRSFAQRYWPGESALGRTFQADVRTPTPPGRQTFTVVGVVADLRMEGVSRQGRDQADGAGFYVPYSQSHERNMTLQIRTAMPLGELLPAVQRTIRGIDPEVGVSAAQTVNESVREQTTDQRLVRDLFTLFGGVAVVLAALGIFGVISAGVTRRRREIGVRLALGARRGHIQGRVVGHALRHWLAGLAVGLAGAVLGGRLLSSFLYRVEPSDAGIWLVAGALLAATAVVASSLPAYRASRVHPVEVLREE